MTVRIRVKAEKTDIVMTGIETEVAVNAEYDLVTAEVGLDHGNENDDQDHVIEREDLDQDQERGNQVGGRDHQGSENAGQDLSSEIGIVEIEPPTVTMSPEMYHQIAQS